MEVLCCAEESDITLSRLEYEVGDGLILLLHRRAAIYPDVYFVDAQDGIL
jgi:hypothetical protein